MSIFRVSDVARAVRENERRVLVAKVRSAIENEGVCPEYHREVMMRHRKEWPSLWKAIDELVKDSKR